METAADLLAAVRAPVAPDAPVGEDLTYDEGYLRIREEMDKLGTVSSAVDHEARGGAGGGGVDYAVVAAEARALLEAKTKDLQLAVYLAFALARARGVDGLAEGLAVLQALAETFWDDVHPQKPLRRRNALQFLSDRGKEWVAAQAFGAADAAALDAARAALVALQALTAERMGEQAPALSGLRQALDEAHRKATAEAAAAAPPPARPASAPPSTDGAAALTPAPPPAAASTPAGTAELRSFSDAKREVRRVGAFLREQDGASPVPYRLARALNWGGILAMPPHENGQTLVEPPDPSLRPRLDGLRGGGNPRALLVAAEEEFPAVPFWLDLQRLVVEAAETAGLPAVAEAVLGELTAFLRRCPDLPTLAFRDGTPLADEATRMWLAARVATERTSAGGDASAGEGEEDPLAASAEAVRKHLASGDLDGALAALSEGAGQDRTARDRFRRSLRIAAVCLQGGQPAVAVPLLDRLAEEADRRTLDEWEPALALEVWALLHAGCTALAAGPAAPEKEVARERARIAYARVCRLDPARALALVPRR